jgi:hypothetical protein
MLSDRGIPGFEVPLVDMEKLLLLLLLLPFRYKSPPIVAGGRWKDMEHCVVRFYVFDRIFRRRERNKPLLVRSF